MHADTRLKEHHHGDVDVILYLDCGHSVRNPVKVGTGHVKTMPRTGSTGFCPHHEYGERRPSMQTITRMVTVPGSGRA